MLAADVLPQRSRYAVAAQKTKMVCVTECVYVRFLLGWKGGEGNVDEIYNESIVAKNVNICHQILPWRDL